MDEEPATNNSREYIKQSSQSRLASKSRIYKGNAPNTFFDFARVPSEEVKKRTSPTPAEPKSKPELADRKKGNRFTGISGTKMLMIKQINDQIKIAMTEEIARDEKNNPKFDEMDLANIINNVLTGLNLHISPGSVINLYDPESDQIHQLNASLKIQRGIFEEMVKVKDHFKNYNTELVKMNNELIKKRDLAYKSRDELEKTLLQERKDWATEKRALQDQIDKLSAPPESKRERKHFEDSDIIQKAWNEFNRAVEVEPQPEPIVPKINIKPMTSDEKIRVFSSMVSVQKEYSPPTPVSVIMDHQRMTLSEKTISNINHNLSLHKNAPRMYTQEQKQIISTVTSYVNAAYEEQSIANRPLFEAKDPQIYSNLLKKRLEEVTNAWQTALDVLAEEQKNSRMLQQKYLLLEKRFAKEMMSRKLKRDQTPVIIQNRGKEVSKSGKKSNPKFPEISKAPKEPPQSPPPIQGKTVIYIPTISLHSNAQSNFE